MANKEVLDQLTAERLTRATDLQALGHATMTLETIIASWQREAALLARSQRKGWQTEAKNLGLATALLKLELIELAKLANRTPPRAPVPLGSMPPALPHGTASLDTFVSDMRAEGRGELIEGDASCPVEAEHDAHTWIGAGNKRYRCAPARIAVAVPTFDLSPVPHVNVADFLSGAVDELPGLVPAHPIGTPEYEEYAAELRTELDKFVHGEKPYPYIPGSPLADREPTSITRHTSNGTPYTVSGTAAVIERLGMQLFTESSFHQEIDAAMPDVHADPLPAVPMFTEAESPRTFTRPIPPTGAVLIPHSWSELAKPADSSIIPDHLSPSQLSTLDTCAAQARLDRYEGNPGIPLWGAVGGTAFHSAVEELERGVMAGSTTLGEIVVSVDRADRIETLWTKHFQTAIAEEITKSGVPMTDWYASNRGKENYSWWLVEGGEMLKRYVYHRQLADDGRKVLVLPDGRPAIELELTLKLDAAPVRVILDIVWQLPDGSLDIWDHKTRGWSMDDPDTIQLGTQGWALREELGVNQPPSEHLGFGVPPITAHYFDARKGVVTEAFDPLDRHPIEELEMRYADADDKRRNRPAIPVRSNLCKACPVAYLCPVGSKL